MKTIFATVGGGLHVGEAPVPEIDEYQVLVRVVYGGICGSDLHYAEHGQNGIYEISEPLILGHEIVGVIERIGVEVAYPWTVGQRVALHPAKPTPEPGGADGRGWHLAHGGSYFGSASTNPHTPGGFANFVAVSGAQIRPVPDGLPLRRAALAEPFAVSLHGINQAGGTLQGKRVLVAGAGPIGCLAIAALRRRGATTVVAADVKASPLRIATQVGAESTVQLGVDKPLEAESFDVVIESSGSPRSLESALHLIRRGGTIVQLGLLPAGRLDIALASLVSKEVSLKGSQRFDIELDDAISILSETPQLDSIVSHVFDAADAEAAFAIAKDSDRSAKVLLQFAADPLPDPGC